MLKIAIVDSGVNCFHKAFHGTRINLVSSDSSAVVQKEYYGHGTAVYNIIKKVEDIAEIINFKVDNIENGIGETELIAILHKINKEYQFDIINLSLGICICEKINELKDICDRLTKKGTVIISAFDNAGSISYPAAFDNVIGVTSGQYCVKVDDFEYIEDNVVNIAAKGGIQRLAWNNPDYIMLGGNSFACAHVTVQVAKFMNDGLYSYEDIMAALKKKATRIHQSKNMDNRIANKMSYEIRKAAIFPFNKEMHSLVRFKNQLAFDIVGVYDSKYSGNVGVSTRHILHDDVEDIIIQNVDNINWDSFDTIILGHMGKFLGLINKLSFQEVIVTEAIQRMKNIYSYDPILLQDLPSNVFFPQITKCDLPPDRFGKLYRIAKPVLGVYGTSSSQGKFTLQLFLRDIFMKLGYKVGQIGTEPSSLLYGMDYVYPMGYNNTVYIHDYEVIRFLNDKLQKLCEKNVDIIITGSQSGIVPYDVGNIVQYSMPQIDFLLGTQPDVVVLCINPFDETYYIKRTLKCIEACGDCKVIGIVMFPMDLKNNWSGIYGQRERIDNEKFIRLSSEINIELKIPVYCLGNMDHMTQIAKDIIEYFS